jgi:molybdopterin synthase catalytic subunit
MVELTNKRISIDNILEHMEDAGTGGVVLFLGRVRNHADGKVVSKMDYEAYPSMAMVKMREIEATASAQWPVQKMAIVHRTGNLKIGEVSVAIAVASAHRKDAFEACRYAIDTLKETVPIWKKEYFVEGEAWVEGVVPAVPDSQKVK